MHKLPTALFIEHPSRIEELKRPHHLEQRKPYIIVQVVTLTRINYENFITDLRADRWFIEKYTDLCHIDEDGIFHCILIKQNGRSNGVLVMSNGSVYPKWVAYLPSKEEAEWI